MSRLLATDRNPAFNASVIDFFSFKIFFFFNLTFIEQMSDSQREISTPLGRFLQVIYDQ